MDGIWANLSTGMRRFLILTGSLAVIVAVGLQFHVSSQGGSVKHLSEGFSRGHMHYRVRLPGDWLFGLFHSRRL